MYKPYEIVQRPIARVPGAWVDVPADPPKRLRTFTATAMFVPGDLDAIRKAVAKIPIYPGAILEAEGGAWVYAGREYLGEIATALRGF